MPGFYDTMAEEYDQVVDVPARQQAADGFIHFLKGYKALTSLLDVACGTGLYAMSAAAAGIPEVVGIDLSKNMLRAAGEAAGERGLSIDFRHMSMGDLGTFPAGGFDAVVCMGNSLPHMEGMSGLRQALSECVRVTVPGGVLAVQVLNYSRILERRERLVGVERQGDIEHIRFYDFHRHTIGFNHLRIDWGTDPATTSLNTTVLTPFTPMDITDCMAALQVRHIECFGSLTGAPFDEKDSHMLLVLARAPAELESRP